MNEMPVTPMKNPRKATPVSSSASLSLCCFAAAVHLSLAAGSLATPIVQSLGF